MSGLITKRTFRLADRMRIQLERARAKEYTPVGWLSCVLLERPVPKEGYSQSRPRYLNAEQAKLLVDRLSLQPFSEAQTVVWVATTLDWLGRASHMPLVGLSHDRQDLLLPCGLPQLPSIPDPLYVSKCATDKVPRVEQKIEERAYGWLKDKNGRRWLLLQPVLELSVIRGTFRRIVGSVEPGDRTHLGLLVDIETDPMEAYFVGGRFSMGM